MRKGIVIWSIQLWALLILSMPVHAQQFAQQDSLRLFSMEDFLSIVVRYHPVARQGVLLNQQADAQLLQSRGAFDPKLYANWQQKSFDGKNYFLIGESGLKIPTWWGAEIKASFFNSTGQFLNPENNLPPQGQAVAGIEMPLLQGLLIDDRRATLAKAKIMQKANTNLQRQLVNDLLLKAVDAYLEWTRQYQQLQIAEEALEISQRRFEGIKENFYQGDGPAIDTLESYIQVQNRQVNLNSARVKFRNSGLQLSVFLWDEELSPLELSAQMAPLPILDELPNPLLPNQAQALLQQGLQSHPELQFFTLKQQQLEVDRRLKVDKLKPKLSVEYNFLADGLDFVNRSTDADPVLNNLLFQNYKWGVNFSFPLLLRKERGQIELASVKLLDNRYKIEQKQWELNNKIQASINELNTLLEQVSLMKNMVENYNKLLVAENIKFSIGESSIFLLNSRETKLIDARLKQVDYQVKYWKIFLKTYWSAGQLPQYFGFELDTQENE